MNYTIIIDYIIIFVKQLFYFLHPVPDWHALPTERAPWYGITGFT